MLRADLRGLWRKWEVSDELLSNVLVPGSASEQLRFPLVVPGMRLVGQR